jgi:hypothetical protein
MTVLSVLCLTVSGCSKRAWVADHGATAAYGEAADPASTKPAPVATPIAPAAPREAPIDPAAEGASVLRAPGALVAEQLPWEEVEPAGADGVECAGAPCHWVQIAAPVDSFGCAVLLRQAGAVLTAAAMPTGASVRHEGGLWKVQLGPFSRWEEAESARDRLRTAGFAAAWLVRR